MADVTVAQFAEVLKVPVDKLLSQLDEAGIKVSGSEDTISDDAKLELLTHLRRSHGQVWEELDGAAFKAYDPVFADHLTFGVRLGGPAIITRKRAPVGIQAAQHPPGIPAQIGQPQPVQRPHQQEAQQRPIDRGPAFKSVEVVVGRFIADVPAVVIAARTLKIRVVRLDVLHRAAHNPPRIGGQLAQRLDDRGPSRARIVAYRLRDQAGHMAQVVVIQAFPPRGSERAHLLAARGFQPLARVLADRLEQPIAHRDQRQGLRQPQQEVEPHHIGLEQKAAEHLHMRLRELLLTRSNRRDLHVSQQRRHVIHQRSFARPGRYGHGSPNPRTGWRRGPGPSP